MEELANSAAIDNISYENNGDEDVETDKATKPVPAPRGHSILERKRSAGMAIFICMICFIRMIMIIIINHCQSP